MRGANGASRAAYVPQAPLRRCCCRAAAAQARDVAALETWLRARGLPEQEVCLRDALPSTGRGLVATRPLPRGAPLLRVPQPLLLTHARAAADAPPPLRDALEALPEWSALALFLAWQRAALAAAPAADVAWGPYVAALPPASGGLLDWPDGEAALLLRGTSLAPAATERLASVAAAVDAIAAGPHADAVAAAGVTRDALRWAFSMLFSRLVRLPSRSNSDDALALVPWADFVNHSPATSAHLDWDGALRCVVLRPDRDYAAGEQVFASYGNSRSSGELLLSYGFAPAAFDGPGGAHESVALQLQLPKGGGDADWKAAALAALDKPAAERFALRAGGGMPPGLLPWAAFAAASFADEASARAAAVAAFAPPPPQQQGWRPFGGGAAPATALPDGRPAEAAARELVLAAIRAALSALDAAEEITQLRRTAPAPPPNKRAGKRAAAPAAPAPDAGRVAAAAAIRGVERRILQRTDFVLRQELRQLAGGGLRR